MTTELPSFSILVPAYNCAEQLTRNLPNLIHQDYPKDLFEVLVVDDGSTDNTAKVAEKLGARVVRHPKNQGRVVTRETAAKEARHERLAFVDARVSVGKDLLSNAARLNYLPLMGVGQSEPEKSVIDRVFFCIRRKVYRPYEPQETYGRELWLKPCEFDGRPKGFGVVLIERDMFLNCALDDKSPDVNDDTRLLARIVNEGAPILRHTNLPFVYEHRHDWASLLRHTFYRGPKFLDYYLSPGGPLFLPWVATLLIAGCFLVACAFYPLLLLFILVAVLTTHLFVCIWMSSSLQDFWACLVFFPPVAIAFLSGIFTAQFARWTGLRKLIRF